MGFINSKSFSLLFLAIFTILLVSQTANAQLVFSPFCKTATYKLLCNKMVKGAPNLHDATVNAINVAINVAKKIQALTPVVVQAVSGLPPEVKSQIIDQCRENFADSIEDLTLSIELFNQGDMGGVGTRLSAAFDSSCIDALKERNVKVDFLSRLNDRFGNIMDNALAVAFQN